MLIINIAGYKFTALDNLENLQREFLEKCQALEVKGTILLSSEGINISLAGLPENVSTFKNFLYTDPRFVDINFHETESSFMPFRRIKVKIKKSIITLRTATVHPEIQRAPDITPQEFKQWLDEGRDITILDTRNDYEVQFGTFKNAINPHIKDFSELPAATKNLDHNKPMVMFCTGGIRCEKAALALLENGFQQVFQLQNGILNYFKQIGDAHYEGECFVFDGRVSLNPDLKVSNTQQCTQCQGPIRPGGQHICG